MADGINAERLQAIEIDLLNIDRGRFDDDLILIIVLEAIGILPVSAIGGTTGGLHIGDLPGFRSQDPEKGGRVKSSCAHFDIIGLLNHTALIRPEPLQGKDQFLKIHHFSLNPRNGVGCITFNDWMSTPEKICIVLRYCCVAVLRY
jgi:hypothetical protein